MAKSFDDIERGFEKIALFADSATLAPRHAAHQIPDGRWESKLGGGIDFGISPRTEAS